MKVRDAINLHKALVLPVVLALAFVYHNFSVPVAIYLGLHGTYSLLWLLKERMYPDKRFEERVPIAIGLLFIFVPLASYWIAPFLLISRQVTVSPVLAAIAISINIVGVFLHYVSDAQKFYTLSHSCPN